MPVKGNQPELYAALEDWFTAPTFPHTRDRHVTTIEKRHGRLETRCLTATTALNTYLRWPDVQQALMLEKRVIHTNTGEVSLIRRYAVTSLSPAQADPLRLLTLWRDHWSIENGLHYPRDVWFGEDASRIWAGSLPEVMALFRNALLSLFHAWGYSSLKFAREHFALHPFQALGLLELPVPLSLK